MQLIISYICHIKNSNSLECLQSVEGSALKQQKCDGMQSRVAGGRDSFRGQEQNGMVGRKRAKMDTQPQQFTKYIYSYADNLFSLARFCLWVNSKKLFRSITTCCSWFLRPNKKFQLLKALCPIVKGTSLISWKEQSWKGDLFSLLLLNFQM